MASKYPWALLGASAALLGAAALEVLRRRQRHGKAYQLAGSCRARHRKHMLRSRNGLPELHLDLLVASPPSATVKRPAEGRELVFYVLDPEPVLFGAAALFSFSQASYFARGARESVEAAFRRLHVVGIGHAAETFKLTGDGFDTQALRQLRRRDFPPRDHPSIKAGREHNAHAKRFAEALADEVAPLVEREMLGLQEEPVRCLLGASYSAVLALQVLLLRPGFFRDFVLGSPSVCFDPEIIDETATGAFAQAALAAGTGVQILLGQREREGLSLPGNVHDHMAAGAEKLADTLRHREIEVNGVNILPEEDHSTVKLALVGRGMTWFASRNQLKAQ